MVIYRRGDVRAAQLQVKGSVCDRLCGSGCAAGTSIEPHTIRLLANAGLQNSDLIYPSPQSVKSVRTNAQKG